MPVSAFFHKNNYTLLLLVFFFLNIYLNVCWFWFELQMVIQNLLLFISSHFVRLGIVDYDYTMVSDVCMLQLLFYVSCMSLGI